MKIECKGTWENQGFQAMKRGGLSYLWRSRSPFVVAKFGMVEIIIAESVKYGSEGYIMNLLQKRWVKMLFMKWFEKALGIGFMDGIRNGDIRGSWRSGVADDGVGDLRSKV